MIANMGLTNQRLAVVTIDLHRGHLDPDVATMPLTREGAEAVITANEALLAWARAARLPVIHVVTTYRDREEIGSNPFWSAVADTSATRANVMRHQLPGSPGLEIVPRLLDPDYDYIVGTKKRYDAFMYTDLEFALTSHNIDTVALTGVNTNSCVLATTVAANARDFLPVVLSDCVATMDDDLHEPALAIIARAFGAVCTFEELRELIKAG